MHSVTGDVLTIISSITAALTFLYILTQVWEPAARRRHNDVVGPSVNVIGTTYAVIIAFMLSGVWSNFRQAESNAEQESNSLVNFFRTAAGFGAADRDRLQKLAYQYAQIMINREWPAMERGYTDHDGYQNIREIWDTLGNIDAQTPRQQVFLQQSMDELSHMTQFRRIRLLQSRSELPALLWAVLIVGAIVTVAVSCLYGVEDFKLHAIQVFSLTFLITLVLVAIGNIDRPFRGRVRVQPSGFEFAIETFDREMNAPGR